MSLIGASSLANAETHMYYGSGRFASLIVNRLDSNLEVNVWLKDSHSINEYYWLGCDGATTGQDLFGRDGNIKPGQNRAFCGNLRGSIKTSRSYSPVFDVANLQHEWWFNPIGKNNWRNTYSDRWEAGPAYESDGALNFILKTIIVPDSNWSKKFNFSVWNGDVNNRASDKVGDVFTVYEIINSHQMKLRCYKFAPGALDNVGVIKRKFFNNELGSSVCPLPPKDLNIPYNDGVLTLEI